MPRHGRLNGRVMSFCQQRRAMAYKAAKMGQASKRKAARPVITYNALRPYRHFRIFIYALPAFFQDAFDDLSFIRRPIARDIPPMPSRLIIRRCHAAGVIVSPPPQSSSATCSRHLHRLFLGTMHFSMGPLRHIRRIELRTSRPSISCYAILRGAAMPRERY